jgi:hypothetical protein
MSHVKATNGNVDTYPYNVGQLRRDNPNTSFPKQIPDVTLAEWGVYPVTVTEQPSFTERTQNCTLNAQPTLADSEWTVGWTVTDKTSEETTQYDTGKAVDNRITRDMLLSETDFYALSDVTMTDAMTTYRQALRDLPSHSNWPNLEDSDWPTKP